MLRLPSLPALNDLPSVIPPRIGHWLADRLGLGAAYEVFCYDHCAWEGWGEPDAPEDTPTAASNAGSDTPEN